MEGALVGGQSLVDVVTLVPDWNPPTKMGCGPVLRNATSSGGGRNEEAWSRKKPPTTSMWGPQSSGFGDSFDDHILANGMW